MAAYIESTPTDGILADLAGDSAPYRIPELDWRQFQRRFHDYLACYGYSIFDADFAKPLPMDDPAPILELLVLYLIGESKNPYVRQQRFANQREAAVEATRSRLGGFKRWAFEKSLKWAQSQAPMREDGIAEIGLGYPVLRRMLQELGSRFMNAGLIGDPKDIFWLQVDDIEQAIVTLENGQAPASLTALVSKRQVEWRARKQITPPPQLPVKAKLLGINMEGMINTRVEQESAVLKGAGASPGKTSGTARVLHGPEDFDQMQPGDVLVAAITTPAWTPLFAMASAVVTDIGGPLSHGSIVAREYGIPAVLGTGLATKRIHSGQRITVDGSAGLVIFDGAE
jgi:pyruvate,water dikinase